MFIKSISLKKEFFEVEDKSKFPFNLKFLKFFENERLSFSKNIVFLTGENGSGKTSLIESFAYNLGLNKFGGSKNFLFDENEKPVLADYLLFERDSILREKDAFFFRAENFFNLQKELDEEYSETGPLYFQYTGSEKTFREMSHGQGFNAFFSNRIYENGVYIFDEPETALSFQSQIEFLFLLKEFEKMNCQIFIVTHSPVLLSFPNSQIFEIGEDNIQEVEFNESLVFENYKNFFENLEIYRKELRED